MLKGAKTYIVAALMAVATFLWKIGVIDTQMYQTIIAFLAPLGLAALRGAVGRAQLGIKYVGKAQPPKVE